MDTYNDFTIPKSILEEAARVISEERVKEYGDPSLCLGRIASMWEAYLGHPINRVDVCMMMVLLKAARDKHLHKLDNLVDICGYTALAGLSGLRDLGDSVAPTPVPDTPEQPRCTPTPEPKMFIDDTPEKFPLSPLTKQDIQDLYDADILMETRLVARVRPMCVHETGIYVVTVPNTYNYMGDLEYNLFLHGVDYNKIGYPLYEFDPLAVPQLYDDLMPYFVFLSDNKQQFMVPSRCYKKQGVTPTTYMIPDPRVYIRGEPEVDYIPSIVLNATDMFRMEIPAVIYTTNPALDFSVCLPTFHKYLLPE